MPQLALFASVLLLLVSLMNARPVSALTAASVTWQTANLTQAQSAASFTTPAPNAYDANVGDTATGYSDSSTPCLCVLWDMGSPVSLSRFEATFLTNYQCEVFYSNDGTNWTDLDSTYTSGVPDTFAPVTARYVEFCLLGSISLSLTDTRLYDGSGALILGPGQTPPVTLPAAPTGFSATGGGNQVTLSWNASPGATSYNLYRGTAPGAEAATPYQTGLTGTSFTDTSSAAGTTYSYRLTAVNAAGESAFSPEACADPDGSVWRPQWTWCDANGNPPQSVVGGPPPVNDDGSANLLGTLTGNAVLTGTYADILPYSVSADPNAPDAWFQPYPYRWWSEGPIYPNPFYAPDAWLYPGLIPGAPTSKVYGQGSSGDPQLGAIISLGNEAQDYRGYSSTLYGTFYHAATGTTTAVPYPGRPIVGTLQANVGVAIAAYLKWTPYYGSAPGHGTTTPVGAPPPPPAPDYMELLLTTHLSASASVDYHASGQTSGLAATALATDEVAGAGFNETVLASAGDAGTANTPAPVVGHHLVRAGVDPTTGIAEVYLNAQTTGTGSNQVAANPNDLDGSATDVSASTQVTATAKPDDRAVTISSPIEISYYKGNSNSGTTDQWGHQRNADGSITVDSVVVWQDFSANSVKGWQVNNLPLTANDSGFLSSSPNYSWTLQGLALPQAWLTYPTANPVDFSLIEPDQTKFPLTGTVVVNVTDSDGAVVTNTYRMTWHLPYEKAVLLGTVMGSDVYETRISDIDQSLSQNVPLSHDKIVNLEGLVDGISVVASVLGQDEIAGLFELLSGISKITNWTYEFQEEPAATLGGMNWQGTWNQATHDDTMWKSQTLPSNYIQHIPPKYFNDPNGYYSCTMDVDRVEYTTSTNWDADKYYQHGYVSPNHPLFTKVITSNHDEPVFHVAQY